LRRIEGRHNAQLKALRRAFDHGELTEEGLCAIEGMRIVEEAIRSGLRVHSVFFSEAGKQRADKLLPQLPVSAEAILVPDKLFRSSVPSESPQGVAALVKVKRFSAAELMAADGALLMVAGIQDPGNLGTILRSGEAFGAAGVFLGEGTARVLNTKVVRASAGSVFRLPHAEAKLHSLLPELRASQRRLIATSSHAKVPIHEAKLAGRVAIFIGNEGAGLEKALLAEMDETVMIPHSRQVESLNAGVAASIALYEAARQNAVTKR
jgi:TrmH family RNA methyltransferase